MRQCTLALASLAVATAGLVTTPATAQDNYPHGFIRNVEPGVSLQRATEVTAEEAAINLPFLPGDRVWTDAAGRAEFQFPEGTVVRLDSRSKLDYSAHDESRDERVVLRLWSGSLIVRTRAREAAIFEIETPGGLVEVAEPGVVRIDVESGETQLSVYEGEASLDTGRDRVSVAGGERTWASWGDAPAEPEPFDLYATDEFSQWDVDLESREAWAANSRRYLPEPLAPYAPEFDAHGSWTYEAPVGYVWQPRVAVGWAPYSNGRWTWTYYGWTWVPYEPWGWVPHHYGRWGFSVSLGWYWSPGISWGSAWVSWGIGGGYVGWCPLGRYNRPVVPWHQRRYRGRAVPRGSIGPDRAWTVVRRGDLARRDIARRRVDPGGVAGLRVAESPNERPNRNGGALTRASAAIPAAARARPRPGGGVRASSGAGVTPRASSGLGGASAAARAAASPRPQGRAATSGLTGSAARARSRSAPGSVAAATSASRSAVRARPRAGTTGSRPAASTSRSSGSTRSRNSLGMLLESRERSSSETRARPRSSAASTPARSTSRPSGVSSRPRSAPRPSVSSPARSTSRPSGVSSRPRSAPRSSVSTPARSTSRPSGVSSRTRSAPRSSGVSSQSRGSSPPRGASSRSSGSSARSGSSGRSAARSRGGARRK